MKIVFHILSLKVINPPIRLIMHGIPRFQKMSFECFQFISIFCKTLKIENNSMCFLFWVDVDSAYKDRGDGGRSGGWGVVLSRKESGAK